LNGSNASVERHSIAFYGYMQAYEAAIAKPTQPKEPGHG